MRVFIFLSFLLGFHGVFGQTEFSLYRLHNTLPQANMLNPAFAPNFKLVIGLPVISSMRGSVDLDSVAFGDLFNRSGEKSFSLDTVRIPNKMKEVNHLRFNQSIQLFYLGVTLGKSYVSLGLHEVSDVKVTYPGDLVGWAIRGPGHANYVGKPLDLGSIYGNGLAYNKASISIGRNLGNRLRLGARFNYLLGMGMVESTKLSGSLVVDIDSVTIQTGEIQLNTAGIDFFSTRGRSPGDYINYFVRTGNRGAAWDFGATYQVTKRFSVSAAVNDIGSITWRDYTRSYRHDPVTYTYRGIDFLEYPGNSGRVDEEVDSLRSLFNPRETTGETFTTFLIGKAYAGINYRVFGMNNLNALIYFDLLRDKRNPILSLGYTMQLATVLNANLGVTFKGGKIDNIGAGLALRLSNFQIFATTERTQSLLHPASATRADLHTGLNLVFGNLEENLPISETNDAHNRKKDKPGKNRVDAATANAMPSTNKKKTSVAAKKPADKRYEINAPDGHRDVPFVSFIVVVGTFTSRDNADQYSRELRRRGITNKFGYDFEKAVYRVYIYRSRYRDDARRMRDTFRKKGRHHISGISVVRVVDSQFE